jgi:secreted PhoX family phosphatase
MAADRWSEAADLFRDQGPKRYLECSRGRSLAGRTDAFMALDGQSTGPYPGIGVEAAGAKKEGYVAKKPGAQQTKKEKRDLHIEPAPAGMSRRRFLTFLGTGSAALAAGSSGILAGCAKSEEEGAANKGSSKEEAAQAPVGGDGKQPFFEPIEPSDADELALPGGFKYDIIRKWGDPVTQDRDYGYNNDFVAYFPIDTLEGGENSEDGLLWVNHEYPIALFVSDYTDPDYETRKTLEQISKEKAATGGSIFRVKKEGGAWKFVESDEYNRRIDATTPMKVTGPAAGQGR